MHFPQNSGSPNVETSTVSADHGGWNILINQSVGATQWKYYSLHIGEFATSLTVQVEHSNSSGEAQRPLNLFVRFGALPKKTNVSVDYIDAAVPNRGWWYIGVFDAAESNRGQSFSLLWKLKSWATDEPKRALFQLEVSAKQSFILRPYTVSYVKLPELIRSSSLINLINWEKV